MGAHLRIRSEPRQGTRRHARLRDGRQLPGATVRGVDRLCVAGRRVHAQGGGNRGVAHQPALRGPGVRERSGQRSPPRHAGHGAAAAERGRDRSSGKPMNTVVTLPLVGRDIRKTFRRATGEVVRALDGVSLEARHGTLSALVGPDGAGKTTLIRLMAGLMAPDSGALQVLDLDVVAQPQAVQDRIGYMPQKFGLYEDLSVAENLDLYADLHGIDAAERARQYPRLLEMTALAPFTKRLAGRLSGGMKQKLGLACTLVRSPELILLDEPTVGVDPLSRRELWDIILHLVEHEGLTVLLSTSYLDEAERCGHAVVLHQGKVLAQGRPAEVSGLAKGRTYVATPPAGQKARGFQARLLDEASVLDALPEGDRVRFVRAVDTDGKAAATIDALDGTAIDAVEPRFEDGFMVLLQRTTSERQLAGAMTLERSLEKEGDGAVV